MEKTYNVRLTSAEVEKIGIKTEGSKNRDVVSGVRDQLGLEALPPLTRKKATKTIIVEKLKDMSEEDKLKILNSL